MDKPTVAQTGGAPAPAQALDAYSVPGPIRELLGPAPLLSWESRTISARLNGVVRAFLCRFIRSPETQLMCRNNSLPGRGRMDNLLGPHI